MTRKDDRSGRAEQIAREKLAGTRGKAASLSPEEIRRTLHDLEVHQIELEIQNEELRRTHAELDATRERYFDLYDLAPVGYVTIGDGGRVLEANLTAATLLGVARNELVAAPLSRFIVDEDRDRFFLHCKRLFESGGPPAFDLKMVQEDGRIFWARLETALARDSGGNPVGRVVLSDVTERVRLADEKSQLQDQLRQSQKLEAIGRLAGGVAHDFNNLTAIILGYTQMILERLGPGDPSRKPVEQIEAAGRRAATLTRQLLAFGRKQTLLHEVLDLNDLIRNLDEMLKRVIGEDIRLELKLDAELGRVHADAGQVEQVITNLVVNARDAMPAGGRLTVETANVQMDERSTPAGENLVPGRYVQIAVTDTGCGMDKTTLGRIFEPFHTTKEKGKGTGLGLATAHGIVKQSGGCLWAASEPGTGTTFRICLPQTDARSPTRTTEEDEAEPRGKGELILLAEDEAPLRELCAALLLRLGYRVSAVANGSQGVRRVLEQGLEPDLVLTDVLMPGMSGALMAKQLQAARPGLKVLFMSGYPDEDIAPHGVLATSTHFIQKPYTERDLAKKIREALAGPTTTEPTGRRVLMVDDDEQYRELVRHFCTKRGHRFTGAESAATAIAALCGSPCEVLLIDLNIPGTSGEQVLREIRTAGCTAPAIILTGDVGSADMDLLRPLGTVLALNKSGEAEPLLREIESIS